MTLILLIILMNVVVMVGVIMIQGRYSLTHLLTHSPNHLLTHSSVHVLYPLLVMIVVDLNVIITVIIMVNVSVYGPLLLQMMVIDLIELQNIIIGMQILFMVVNVIMVGMDMTVHNEHVSTGSIPA